MDEQERIRELTEENADLKLQVDRLRKVNTSMRSKSREFSKIILAGAGIVTAFVTLFSCIMAWRTDDTSILNLLIPAVFAEMASATGFYYSKAKAENKIKLMILAGLEPKQEDFD